MPRELFISVDIETSGPIPEQYSLLSIGACVVGNTAENFYIELMPLNDNYTAEAEATCKMSLDTLRREGTEPRAAMRQFAQWVEKISDNARVIFIGFNAPFDWSFVNYYFIKFLGLDQNPFGHSALDIKSYYMGAYKTSWKATSMKRLPPDIHSPDRPLAHNALGDAIQQADIFEKLLQTRE